MQTLTAPSAADRARFVYFETFGCQMNVYDTERMLETLHVAGYSATDDVTLADLVVLNTCSVREKAEHKMDSRLGKLRRLKEHNPELILAVSGCVAQQEGVKLLKRMPYLDLVIGPDQMAKLPGLVGDARDKSTRHAAIEQTHRKHYDFIKPLAPTDGRVTSFVTVMKGCNKFCSFCIVPTTRGREVSKPSDEVVDEVRVLVEAGVVEVTLLGQNVNSYGRDKKGAEVDFAGLLRKVHGIDGLQRIRFTTSHPMDCNDSLIEAFGDLPKLMPWFHLPVQSGSERVLRMMRRRTVIEDYVARIERLRELRPGIAMSTDIIVGFPGESDADFEQTIALLERVRYATIYAFAYSERPGTAAARIPDDVPRLVKKARLNRVLQVQKRITDAWMAGHLDAQVEVVFEGMSTMQAKDMKRGVVQTGGALPMPQLMGRTPHNIKVNVNATEPGALFKWPGKTATVRVAEVKAHSLFGADPVFS